MSLSALVVDDNPAARDILTESLAGLVAQVDAVSGGAEAVAALAAVSAMNVALFDSLSAVDRGTTMVHPEYGSITVDWIIYTIAGHQVHHLDQLLSIPNS